MSRYQEEPQDKDWERISELLMAADCVPEAPDCRAAVRARIGQPRPVRRLTWAWSSALATVVLAAIGIHFVPLVLRAPQTNTIATPPVMNQPAAAPAIKQPASNEPVTKPAVVARASRTPRPAAPMAHVAPPPPSKPVMTAVAPRSANKWFAAREYKTLGKKSEEVTTTGSEVASDRMPASAAERVGVGGYRLRAADGLDLPAPTASPSRGSDRNLALYDSFVTQRSEPVPAKEKDTTAYDDTRSVAVAVVTWPSQNGAAANSSYGYTDRDTATGVTTECRVKRSGNAVEIYMESKPAPDPPAKGGTLDHETMPNA